MTLGQTQRKFTRCVGQLIMHAYAEGYEISLGDAYRDPRVFGMVGANKPAAYGHRSSCHKSRLAIDLNLFKDGEFLHATSDHADLGSWWEALGKAVDLPLTWGGRFNDGNHYSCAWKGQK